mgnify:CR=1 FL=1
MKNLHKSATGFTLNGEAPANFYFDESVEWDIMLDTFQTCLEDLKWNVEYTSELSILTEEEFKTITNEIVTDYINAFTFMDICLRKGLTVEAQGFRDITLDLYSLEIDLYNKNTNVYNPNDGLAFTDYMEIKYDFLINALEADVEFYLDVMPEMEEEALQRALQQFLEDFLRNFLDTFGDENEED